MIIHFNGHGREGGHILGDEYVIASAVGGLLAGCCCFFVACSFL